jgi:hypothetical protein
MQDTLGDNRSLSRTEFDRPAFEINQQLPLEHVEKFVIIIMLVPVVLALHNAKTNHGAIHLTESLVVPFVRARIGERLFVNYLQWPVKDVQSGLVWKVFSTGHNVPPHRDSLLLLAMTLRAKYQFVVSPTTESLGLPIDLVVPEVYFAFSRASVRAGMISKMSPTTP